MWTMLALVVFLYIVLPCACGFMGGILYVVVKENLWTTQQK